MDPFPCNLHVPRVKRREQQRAVSRTDGVVHLLACDWNIVQKKVQIQGFVQCRGIRHRQVVGA